MFAIYILAIIGAISALLAIASAVAFFSTPKRYARRISDIESNAQDIHDAIRKGDETGVY